MCVCVCVYSKCTLESGMCKKCSIQHKMYAREWDVQKVLYTEQNVCSRVGCAKSALYRTKCTLESRMCKKCSIQHKMYAQESDVQKGLYTAQNVRSRVGCSKSTLNNTKCSHPTLERTFCAV